MVEVPARIILWILLFAGAVVNFMSRVDMNMAMVAMARSRLSADSANSNTTTQFVRSHCYVYTNDSVEVTNNSNEDGEFSWSPNIQNTIIGSFYWSYMGFQIAGGEFAQRFSLKKVIWWSQFLTALCALIIPWGAGVHWILLLVIRVIQGTASSLSWPAIYAILAIWSPVHERSRFLSSLQGIAVGTGITYIGAGFLIASFGWRSVFYTTSSLGLLWCVFWHFLAFDEPSQHPRISPSELQYIQKHTPDTQKGLPAPWRVILTSGPVWLIGIVTFGRIWVRFTFLISGLRYLQTVLGLSIRDNGLLAGVPNLISVFSSFFFCWLGDRLRAQGVMSVTNIRRYNTFLSQVVPGVLLLVIGYLGCDRVTTMVLWFIAEIMGSAFLAGSIGSVVDIAPNMAGPVLGFVQTIIMTASFLAPQVAGAITNTTEGPEQWRIVFIVAAAVAILTYIPYQIYGTAEIQNWNYPGGKPPSDSIDILEPLQSSQNQRSEELL